jgi:hypothetical protein
MGQALERLIGEQNWKHKRGPGCIGDMSQVYSKKGLVFNAGKGRER